jgi:hypothetical protein
MLLQHVATGSGHVRFRTFLVTSPRFILQLRIIHAYLDARMEQRVRRYLAPATEMGPDTNGQPCSMSPRYASMDSWTYHHSVTHFPFRFWYVYDIGRISGSHHKGLYFSSSVTFCTASCSSSVALSSLGSSALWALCPSGWDESSFCPIVRGMCSCSNASKSNRMWQSAHMISSIIHRREMLERQCLVVFSATPPPTSTTISLPRQDARML